MSMPKIGAPAPNFALPSVHGTTVSLKDFKGRNIVLYFYPKDDTPGCTTEACGFRDAHTDLSRKNAVILGVSPDNVDQHQAFTGKYNLPFILLSDAEKKVCRAYGVWVKKSMYGKSYMGVARTTFVIGPDGKIKRIFEKVKPAGHPQEIAQALDELAVSG